MTDQLAACGHPIVSGHAITRDGETWCTWACAAWAAEDLHR